jgi:hypothetical protein
VHVVHDHDAVVIPERRDGVHSGHDLGELAGRIEAGTGSAQFHPGALEGDVVGDVAGGGCHVVPGECLEVGERDIRRPELLVHGLFLGPGRSFPQ